MSATSIWERVIPVWLALMALLGITVFGAYQPVGTFNLLLALGIAVAKIALVALFFMRLREPDPLLRLAAGAAGLWILFLFSLSFVDLLTRPAPSQPGVVTPRSEAPPARAEGSRAF
ncbi:cytochrome C oxidase subunit IV family protein [Falsiroseomonas sp. HW251]|uniref:cytochrome C oxidase subunit IV family protein n=1 Tax=Falsiroseomonas sp. HW251 TaxID=3390998 RepID=UPI003D31FE28